MKFDTRDLDGKCYGSVSMLDDLDFPYTVVDRAGRQLYRGSHWDEWPLSPYFANGTGTAVILLDGKGVLWSVERENRGNNECVSLKVVPCATSLTVAEVLDIYAACCARLGQEPTLKDRPASLAELAEQLSRDRALTLYCREFQWQATPRNHWRSPTGAKVRVRLASPDDLTPVTDAQAAFRTTYADASYPADFTGTWDDIRAMDYMWYEGIPYPGTGLREASLAWAAALRRIACLQWLVVDRAGDFQLAIGLMDTWPTVIIWPTERLLEAHACSMPQFGKVTWATERALLDLLALDLDHADNSSLRGQLANAGGDASYISYMRAALEKAPP